MERSLKQHEISRGLGIDFGNGIKCQHLNKVLKIERMLLKHVALIPCQTSPGGKIAIRNVSLSEPGVVPIDLELMNHLLFHVPDFFDYLIEKAGIKRCGKIAVLCNGSIIMTNGKPSHKVYLSCMPEKNQFDTVTIKKDFWGKLPPMYQLVYRVPKSEYNESQMVA